MLIIVNNRHNIMHFFHMKTMDPHDQQGQVGGINFDICFNSSPVSIFYLS